VVQLVKRWGAWEGSIFSLLCWGVPKNIGGGSIKWFLLENKKKDCGCTSH